MEACVRSRFKTGLVVLSVGALVLAPVDSPNTPVPAEQAAVALAAQTRGLSVPSAPATVAPVDLLRQQVDFHVDLAVDFVVTGAQLLSRQVAVPGTLLRDIRTGTPVPAAVGRALRTLVEVELDAGRELVGFVAEYVDFQINFLRNLVRDVMTRAGTTAMAFTAFATEVVGQLVSSVAARVTPMTTDTAPQALSRGAPAAVSATPSAVAVPTSRRSVDHSVERSDGSPAAATDVGETTSTLKKIRSAITSRADANDDNVSREVSTGATGLDADDTSAKADPERTLSRAGDNNQHADRPGLRQRLRDLKPKSDGGTNDTKRDAGDGTT
jgi:hypothetical protein